MLSATNLCKNGGWAYFQAEHIFAALRYMYTKTHNIYTHTDMMHNYVSLLVILLWLKPANYNHIAISRMLYLYTPRTNHNTDVHFLYTIKHTLLLPQPLNIDIINNCELS